MAVPTLQSVEPLRHPRTPTPPIDPQAAGDAEGECLAAKAAALRFLNVALLGLDGADEDPISDLADLGGRGTSGYRLLLLEHGPPLAEAADGCSVGARQQRAGMVVGAVVSGHRSRWRGQLGGGGSNFAAMVFSTLLQV